MQLRLSRGRFQVCQGNKLFGGEPSESITIRESRGIKQRADSDARGACSLPVVTVATVSLRAVRSSVHGILDSRYACMMFGRADQKKQPKVLAWRHNQPLSNGLDGRPPKPDFGVNHRQTTEAMLPFSRACLIRNGSDKTSHLQLRAVKNSLDLRDHDRDLGN